MANIRQYIGARYVIKIYENSTDPSSAEWEQGNFEPLVMVTWQNGSYLSKKEVPGTVGNPANNPDYWVQTGFYNGQIAALQQQIDTINNSVIPAINNTISAIDVKTDSNSMKLKNLPDRKILFIGDSYAGIDNGSGQNYVDIAATILGCDYVDVKHAGIGFTNINSQGTFLEYLQTVTSDRDTYTDIVVCGGCNDYDTVANTKDAIKTFCEYVFENFPNAKITIAHIGGFATRTLQTQQIKTKSLPSYRSCSQFGATYMENSEYIMYSPNVFNSDNVHPLSTYVNTIGELVAEGILNGICHVEAFSGAVPSDVGASEYHLDTTGYNPAITTYINNNRVGLYCSGYQLGTIVIDDANAFSNGVFEHKVYGGIPIFGFGGDWTNGFYSMPVMIRFNGASYLGRLSTNLDNTLTLQVWGVTAATGNMYIFPLTTCEAEFDASR